MYRAIYHGRQVLADKVEIFLKPDNMMARRTDNYELLNEVGYPDKLSTKNECKKIGEGQTGQHKKETSNRKVQYEHLLDEREKESEEFAFEVKGCRVRREKKIRRG